MVTKPTYHPVDVNYYTNMLNQAQNLPWFNTKPVDFLTQSGRWAGLEAADLENEKQSLANSAAMRLQEQQDKLAGWSAANPAADLATTLGYAADLAKQSGDVATLLSLTNALEGMKEKDLNILTKVVGLAPHIGESSAQSLLADSPYATMQLMPKYEDTIIGGNLVRKYADGNLEVLRDLSPERAKEPKFDVKFDANNNSRLVEKNNPMAILQALASGFIYDSPSSMARDMSLALKASQAQSAPAQEESQSSSFFDSIFGATPRPQKKRTVYRVNVTGE